MTKQSILKSQARYWTGIAWSISVYLIGEGTIFVLAMYAFHLSEERLLGPYLALASPATAFLIFLGCLRKWERLGTPPRTLAVGWGLSMAVFFLTLCVAFFYSSVELRVVNPGDAIWVFGLMGAAGAPASFFALYNLTLERVCSGSEIKLTDPKVNRH